MKQHELALENLQHCMSEKPESADEALWLAVVAFQGSPFATASGLPFWYTLKKSGSGELIVSRKEGSKTLTRSSVLYAFHIVREAYRTDETGIDTEKPSGTSGGISGSGTEGYIACRRRHRHAKEAPEWMLWQDSQAVPAEDRAEIPAYYGPKAIGQIFGISYIYSLFFRFGLIRVPRRVAEKMISLIRQGLV